MIEPQTMWSWLPAIYLFLGGMGATAFTCVSIIRLACPDRYKTTVTIGVWISLLGLVFGLFALLAEVTKPLQAAMLFMSFVNFNSWMTIGAWILLITVVIVGLSVLLTTDKIFYLLAKLIKPLGTHRDFINKVLAIIGIPFSLFIAVYTGILLSSSPGIPVWGTWLLPALFTVAAIDVGLAAILIALGIFEHDKKKHVLQYRLELGVIVFALLECIVLAVYVVTMQNQDANTARSIEMLITGQFNMQFWGLVVIVGLVIPLIGAIAAVLAHKKKAHLPEAVGIFASVCALIGGFSLRFLILSIGLHAAMVAPVAELAIKGILLK